MPQVPIIMPQLGESMAEATIVAIKVNPGEKVAVDQEVIEVETDKAVMGVTTPCAGEIAGIEAEGRRRSPHGSGNYRRRDEQSRHGRDHAVQRKDR